MMKATSIAVLAALALWAGPLQAQETTDPSGVWMRDDGNARVEIAPCGSDLCATNLWIGDTSQGEEAGDRLVMSLQPESGTTLSGTAYDEKRDRTYSMTLEVREEGLVTRGCVLGGLVCRNVSWTAVN